MLCRRNLLKSFLLRVIRNKYMVETKQLCVVGGNSLPAVSFCSLQLVTGWVRGLHVYEPQPSVSFVKGSIILCLAEH